MDHSVAEQDETLIFETDTELGHYQVVDMVYDGRPARVLFSGQRYAAQSGIAHDDRPELLFDYNQRFIELAEAVCPKRVLLIGGGAYTLPMALMKRFPGSRLDVVELDSGLQAIAMKYFDFQPAPGLTVITGDGKTYLETTTRAYDLILIDAFKHDIIPKELATSSTVAIMAKRLRSGGVVGVNVISAYYGKNAERLKQLYGVYAQHFTSVSVVPASGSTQISYWMPQNFILIAQLDSNTPFELRYATLEPPV